MLSCWCETMYFGCIWSYSSDGDVSCPYLSVCLGYCPYEISSLHCLSVLIAPNIVGGGPPSYTLRETVYDPYKVEHGIVMDSSVFIC